jgi:hypothetical protein
MKFRKCAESSTTRTRLDLITKQPPWCSQSGRNNFVGGCSQNLMLRNSCPCAGAIIKKSGWGTDRKKQRNATLFCLWYHDLCLSARHPKVRLTQLRGEKKRVSGRKERDPTPSVDTLKTDARPLTPYCSSSSEKSPFTSTSSGTTTQASLEFRPAIRASVSQYLECGRRRPARTRVGYGFETCIASGNSG